LIERQADQGTREVLVPWDSPRRSINIPFDIRGDASLGDVYKEEEYLIQ
jgi:hypothetical protein